MTDREIERRLKTAVEHAAPDGLQRLLSDAACEKGVIKMENTKKRSKFRWAGLIAACLIVAVFAGFGGFWYGQNRAVATVVSLDVNPSIELRVSRAEKVLKCDPLNAEAKDVLSSMDGGRDLEGAKLDVAVNAIVGAIVREGYLDSLGSAILISVDDKDAERGARLQAELVATVDGILKNASNSASVMSQNVTTDSKTADRAQEYGISTGKAAYIEQVLALNSSLDYAKLAELSVEELRDLIRIGAPAMPIGRAAAAQAAEEYAGVNVVNSYLPQYTEVDPEIDDLTPHYDVEINYLGREYEYEIDAFTGEVLRGLSRIISDNPGEPWPEKVLTADEAFNAAAEYFSENHPELRGNFLNIENWYSVDDGWFEIEFWCQGWEFEYDVDGQTGAVLREETDYRYTPPTQPENPPAPTQPAQPTQPTQPSDIGAEAAKAAALKHAGLAAGDVTFTKAQRDYDDGKLVYDVEFVTADTEYDYEIDAATGAVLKFEREALPGASTPGTDPGTPSVTDIGAEAAKAAALKHAGLAAGDVTFTKAKRDYDNGKLVYDVEFVTADTEYDYEIDAATGAVLKFEREALPGTSTPGTNPGAPSVTDIGVEAAKAAALKHAGLAAGDVSFTKAKRDYDDGKLVYDVEFVTADTEYDYEIDAATGAVLKSEREALPGASTPGANPGTPSVTDIGMEAAKAAALKRAGVTGAVDWLKMEHDYDDGRHYYELEFEVNATVYECDVDAATGEVVKFESEPCDNFLHNHTQNDSGSAQSGDIGAEAAKDAALRHAGLTESQVRGLKCEKDRDDGRTVYEVEFKSNGWEYEYKIDAATGAVLEHERDRDD